jgi:hypothetical protein
MAFTGFGKLDELCGDGFPDVLVAVTGPEGDTDNFKGDTVRLPRNALLS